MAPLNSSSATAELLVCADQLRKNLDYSVEITTEANDLLNRCSQQLKELDRLVQPMTVRTLALTKARDNLRKAKERAEEVLEYLDASREVEGVINEGPRANLQAFLQALTKLDGAIEFLQQHRHMHTAADALAHTTALRGRALEACASEFRAVLEKHSLVPPSLLALQRQNTSSTALTTHGCDLDVSNLLTELLPQSVIPKLRALAQAQTKAGSRSCIKIYSETRRSVLQQCLDPLLEGVGTREEVARTPAWRPVEARIPGWEAAVKLLAQGVREEARLVAALFQPEAQAELLQQVSTSAGRAVAEAGDAILAAKRVPDKIFGLLAMHDALTAALPMLRSALAQHSTRLDRISPDTLAAATDLAALQSRVGVEARACFGQLQESYGGRVSESFPPNATVHPLCGSTVAALKRLLSYESALGVLFGQGEGPGAPPPPGGTSLQEGERLLGRMSSAVTTILDNLLGALESKAKASYRSPALCALHMLNNAQFLAAAAASRELNPVAEAWLEARSGQVAQYQRQYMEHSWQPLVRLLKQPPPLPPRLAAGAALDKGVRQAVKDHWAAVNKAMEPIMSHQAGWTVVEPGLRYRIKDSVSDLVIPLYQSFTDRYAGLAFTEHRGKYVRVSVAQLRDFVALDLFERSRPSDVGGGGDGSSLQSRGSKRW